MLNILRAERERVKLFPPGTLATTHHTKRQAELTCIKATGHCGFITITIPGGWLLWHIIETDKACVVCPSTLTTYRHLVTTGHHFEFLPNVADWNVSSAYLAVAVKACHQKLWLEVDFDYEPDDTWKVLELPPARRRRRTISRWK